MKLAVVAAAEPLDIHTWSGTPFFMTKTLKERFPDLITVTLPTPAWFSRAGRLAMKASAGYLDIAWSPKLGKFSAKQIARRLKVAGVDVAISIANSPVTAFLADQIPTIHVSDATVPLMKDYYDEFARLPNIVAANAFRLDSMSVLRSRACLYPTEWAARSAIKDYGAEESRVHAVSWGANIDGHNVYSRSDHHVCNLVFIGIDWERKGGTIAVEAAMRLAASGLPTKLHIIGSRPSLPISDSIVVHGFIDKRTDQGRAEFDRIMREASFLFVPTRQECFGIVFPEANSYGVPVIATQTGGVPDVVHEGVNGHLLPLESPAQAYADLIRSIWLDRSRYEKLRASSRTRYENALNWNSWLKAVVPVIEYARNEKA